MTVDVKLSGCKVFYAPRRQGSARRTTPRTLTSAVDGASNFAPRSLYPLGRATVAIVLEAEARWAPEPVWTFWRRGNSLERTGNRVKLLGRPIAAFCVNCMHHVVQRY
jgi:hypothetical protein